MFRVLLRFLSRKISIPLRRQFLGTFWAGRMAYCRYRSSWEGSLPTHSMSFPCLLSLRPRPALITRMPASSSCAPVEVMKNSGMAWESPGSSSLPSRVSMSTSIVSGDLFVYPLCSHEALLLDRVSRIALSRPVSVSSPPWGFVRVSLLVGCRSGWPGCHLELAPPFPSSVSLFLVTLSPHDGVGAGGAVPPAFLRCAHA